MLETRYFHVIKPLVPDYFSQDAVWYWEKQEAPKLSTKKIQSNGLPFNARSFAYYTGRLIPVPKG